MSALNVADDDTIVTAGRRVLLRPLTLVVAAVATALGIVGVIASVDDPGFASPVAMLRIAAPGVVSVWLLVSILWQRGAGTPDLVVRILLACLIAPFLVVIPVAIGQLVATAIPAFRAAVEEAVAARGGTHEWWGDGYGISLVMTIGGGWIAGASLALFASLILVLPIASFTAPGMVLGGSRIENLPADARVGTARRAFCGVAAATLGVTLWVAGGGDHISRLAGSLRALVRYGWSASDGVWTIGVALVALGIVLLGWAAVRIRRHHSAD